MFANEAGEQGSIAGRDKTKHENCSWCLVT